MRVVDVLFYSNSYTYDP